MAAMLSRPQWIKTVWAVFPVFHLIVVTESVSVSLRPSEAESAETFVKIMTFPFQCTAQK